MGENDDIENRLKCLKLKQVPPGLREKVLETAVRRARAEALTTPLLRWCLAGCATILAAVFIADSAVTRHQNSHLRALFDGSGQTPAERSRKWEAEIKELWDAVGPDMLGGERWLLVHRRMKPAPTAGSGPWKELTWEDIHESEITKNIN